MMAGVFTMTQIKSYSAVNIPRTTPHYNNPAVVVVHMKQSYRATVDADVEAHLKQAMTTIKSPLVVSEPMHHLTYSAPRNTAPALCIAACELVGGTRHQAVAAAAAIHLMHVVTYMHEHLTLTDGGPTYGPNIKLLIGDGLLPFGFELLTRSDSKNLVRDDSGRVLRVLIEIARATGSQGIINGQYNEVITRVGDEHVWEKKEGVLPACGAACGAILGGGSEDEVERLRKFGVYVGMIHGMLNKINGVREEKVLKKKVEELRNLAMETLVKGFDNGKIEAIASLVDYN